MHRNKSGTPPAQIPTFCIGNTDSDKVTAMTPHTAHVAILVVRHLTPKKNLIPHIQETEFYDFVAAAASTPRQTIRSATHYCLERPRLTSVVTITGNKSTLRDNHRICCPDMRQPSYTEVWTPYTAERHRSLAPCRHICTCRHSRAAASSKNRVVPY